MGVAKVGDTLRPYVRYNSRTAGVVAEHRLAWDAPGTTLVNDPFGDFVWVAPDVWTHLAATYSASNALLSLYIDGTLVATRTDAMALPVMGSGEGRALAGELSIGGGAVDANGEVIDGFIGAIDDVRLSALVSSAADIRQMMGGQIVTLGNEDATNAVPRAVGQAAEVQPQSVPREFLVGVASKGAMITAKAALEAKGLIVKRSFKIVPAMHVALADGQDTDVLMQEIKALGSVTYVEPNYIRHLTQTFPGDPDFGSLWGLNNTGQDGGVADADIDGPEGWDVATGNRDVIVAVIDTGVDYTHADLAANMWINPGEIPANGIDDDGNGYVDDVYGYDFGVGDSDPMDSDGHGTHCSGIIGAVGNNAVGVAGVNWTARIMALKVFDDAGTGASDASIVAAIEYAWKMGARVSNNSYGGLGFSQTEYDAIRVAGENDHLFVAAAGNNGTDNDALPFYPASFDLDNIVAVAATDRRDAMAGFSCYGATAVDLGAPGVDILSTAPGDAYQLMSGTSMACPHVAGAATLILSVDGRLNFMAVKAALLGNADPIPALDGRCVSGGRLNIGNILPNLDDGSGGGGQVIVRTLAGWFKFDDGGATVEDFTLAAGWRDDWRFAGRVEGGAVVTNALIGVTARYGFLPAGDSDADGIPDWWEEAFGLDPRLGSGDDGGEGDPDGDGLTNFYEYLASLAHLARGERGLNPRVYDTDNDGVSDAFEDSDNDDIANIHEQNFYRTHPGWADTDDDDAEDGDELTARRRPTDSASVYQMTALTFGGSADPVANTVLVSDKVGTDFTERHSSMEWTIEVWVNVTEPVPAGSVFPLVSRKTYATGRRNYEIGLTNGIPYAAFDGIEFGPVVLLSGSTNSLTTNTWTHIAARFLPDLTTGQHTLAIFVDGIRTASVRTGWLSATGPGDLIFGSPGFIGQLSNIRIWKIARPDDQISGTMGTDLLAGSVANMAGYLTLPGGGHLKETATITLPNGDSIDMLRQDWTLECWVRTTASGRLILRRNSSARTDDDFNYFLGVAGNGTLIGRFMEEYGAWVMPPNALNPYFQMGEDPDINNITGEIPVNDGEWHHVAYVRDADFCYLYVDGLLDTKQERLIPEPINFIIPSPDNYWRVKATGGPCVFGEDLAGDMDEIRIWNRSLSAVDLADVGSRNLGGNERGLISYFNFDFQIGKTADERATVRDSESEYGIYIPNATRVAGLSDGPDIRYDPLLSVQGVALTGLFLGNDGGVWVEDRTHRIGLDPFDGWRYAGVRGTDVTFSPQIPILDLDGGGDEDDEEDPDGEIVDNDGDYTEDWWEDLYDPYYANSDVYDSHLDRDDDGWDNWSEARYTAKSGLSTRPDQAHEATSVPLPEVAFTFHYPGLLKNGSLVVLAYSRRAMDGAPDATFEMGAPDYFPVTISTNSVPAVGRLRQGNNWLFAFIDLSGNRVWDPGEPAGLAERFPYDVGWDKNAVTFTLSDAPVNGFVRQTWPAVAGKSVYGVSIWRITWSGTNAVYTSVFSKNIHEPRNWLHEGDILDPDAVGGGNPGLDWDGRIVGTPTIPIGTAMAYQLRVDNVPVGVFTNYYWNTILPTPVADYPRGAVVTTPRPEFRWTMTTVASAFELRIVPTNSTTVLYSSGVLPAPEPRNAEGLRVWSPPIHWGDLLPALNGGSGVLTNGAFRWEVRAYQPRLVTSFTSGAFNYVSTISAYSGYETVRVNLSDTVTGLGSIRVELGAAYLPPNARIRVQAFTTASLNDLPVVQRTLIGVNTLPQTVTLNGLQNQKPYFIAAYIDQNTDNVRAIWESWGYYRSITVNPEWWFQPVMIQAGKLNQAPIVPLTIMYTDTDQDLIPDAYEYAVSGGLAGSPVMPLSVGETGNEKVNPGWLGVLGLTSGSTWSDPLYADYDRDGIDDRQEYQLGLSATASDQLYITSLGADSQLGTLNWTWAADAGSDGAVALSATALAKPVRYVLERTDSLSNPDWTMVAERLTDQKVGAFGHDISRDMLDPSLPAGFYRIRVVIP